VIAGPVRGDGAVDDAAESGVVAGLAGVGGLAFPVNGTWSFLSQRCVTGSRGQSARLFMARSDRSAFLTRDGICYLRCMSPTRLARFSPSGRPSQLRAGLNPDGSCARTTDAAAEEGPATLTGEVDGLSAGGARTAGRSNFGAAITPGTEPGGAVRRGQGRGVDHATRGAAAGLLVWPPGAVDTVAATMPAADRMAAGAVDRAVTTAGEADGQAAQSCGPS
jgi:hypothetical protein